MIKNVTVLVKTNIYYHESTNELLEHQFNGTQFFKDNNIFLRYKDNSEQDIGDIWTTVKWNEDEKPSKLTVIRHGEAMTKHVFQEGCTHISQYHSLNVPLEMEITTKKLNIKREDNDCKILVKYNIKLNSQFIGDYILTMELIFDK